MREIIFLICSSLLIISCVAQNNQKLSQNTRLVGGPCEGCEAVFEFGEKELKSIDTLPGFDDSGIKILVEGVVYKPDGVTPAENVILYFYQTDQNGLYASKGDEDGWGKRHGYIRDWVKTNKNGKYSIYTLKPAAYPTGTEASHIHITVLEPNGKYYWLHSYNFEGDPLLSNEETNVRSIRGGNSNILSLVEKNGFWHGKRDIILGKNIPGYK